VQTLTVIHPDLTRTEAPSPPEPLELEIDNNLPAHALIEPQHSAEFHAPGKYSVVESTAQSTHAVTVIIVVCVGFLLFMIVLGVVRIRAAHTRAAQEDMQDAELAWDDSGLNITVNPMETMTTTGAPSTMNSTTLAPRDSSDSDSSDSADEDDNSDDDELGGPIPTATKQSVKESLDWDPSI